MTDQLRHIHPPVDTVATDIHGVLARVGLRMRHARAGEKLLVLATDMAENTASQVTPDLSLRGVRVVFLTPCAENATDCEQSMTYWQRIVLTAGGQSATFLDPTEAQTQQNLFAQV
jgi:hypothetical protein